MKKIITHRTSKLSDIRSSKEKLKSNSSPEKEQQGDEAVHLKTELNKYDHFKNQKQGLLILARIIARIEKSKINSEE